MTERQIFTQAVEITEPARREEFLSQACGADHALRARVDELLAAHLAANSQFLETPVVDQLQESTDPGTEKTVALPPKKGGDEDEEELPGQPDLSFLQPSTKPGSIGTLGHYEILSILGHGAFGIVFKAFDEKLHRHVAIKMMSAQIAATSPARKRFLREARAAAAIRHDNVTQVYSVEEEPVPYLVMEFIDGQTLQSKQRKQGPLEVAELLHIGRQIAAGLAAAHEKSLIHRDVKPGNILLEQGVEQKVKITDFGLARAADDASLTRSGMISGTPLYMAPEQALGGTLDGRSDLFSLGSVLYELATGRPPFRAPSTVAVLRRVVDDTPRPMREIIPELPEWFVTIVNRLLEKQPEKRYQSAKEVAELFARCQSELQLSGQVTCVPGAGSVSARSTTPGTNITPASVKDSGGSRPPLSGKPSYKSLLLSLLLGVLVVSPILFGKKISSFISPLIWGQIPTLPIVERAAGLRFDGKDDFIQVPVQWDTPVFTIEAFVTSEEGVPSGTLLHLSNEKRAGIESIELFDEQNQAGQPQSFAGVVGGKSQGYLAAPLQRGARQHRVLTFDGDHLHYYVNGLWQAKRHVLPEDQLIWKLRQLTIGCKQDRTNFFAGAIDQLRISKVVRYRNNFAPITSVTSDDSTLALYDFDEGTGDVLRDSSGNGANGKILGATWVHPAKGLQFDGVDDYVDFENLAWSSNQYTFETWITPLAEHGTLFQIAVPEGNMHAYLYEGGSGSGLNRDKSYTNVNGPRAGMKRQHLATVFDGKNLSYFIDGKLAGSKTNVSDLTTPWTFQRLRIGGKLDPNSSKPEFFHGRMEQFRVSKSARYVLPFTPEETLTPTADTIALYNFDENQGAVLKDATGHGHDGKIVGATWVKPSSMTGSGARTFHSGEWIDALSLINPGSDKFDLPGMTGRNDWKREGNHLVVGPDKLASKLVLPLDSTWSAFECELEFIRRSGAGGLNLNLPTRKGECSVVIDHASGNGGVFLGARDKGVVLSEGRKIEGGKHTTLNVTVRRVQNQDQITVSLNGKATGQWTGNRNDIGKESTERFPVSRRISLWIHEGNNEFEFQRIRLRPLDGETVATTRPQTGWHGWPEDAPQPAIAPFTAQQAKQYQTAWAKHLGIPTEFTDKHGMKFVLIPPGEFQMGFSKSELDTLTRELKQAGANEFDLFSASTSGPQHPVRITQPLYMSAHEVTIAQYRSFLEETKYLPTADQLGGKMKWTNFVPKENPDSYPVDGVSWTDADSFCTLRSQRDGVTYRLPSEAEWEFACRAGTTTLWSFGDNPGQLGEYAATTSAGVTQLQPVGSRKPNALGLFDMYGNAEEWCRDWHVQDYYAKSPVDDPVNLATPADNNSGRVSRGGSLSSAVWMTRSSLRRWDYPSTPVSPKGFRVVITGDLKKVIELVRPPGFASSASSETNWHGWPADAPRPAIAPFNAEQAKRYQEEWAAHLKVPVEYTNSLGMKFRLIPPGEFLMGSTPEEIEEALPFAIENMLWKELAESEAPRHKVILTQPIYLGVHEVTQAEYEKVIGHNPSHFAAMGAGKDAVIGKDTTRHPVDTVNWNDAAEFCVKLSQLEKFNPLDAELSAGETVSTEVTGYRLPTEAEWEFCCRAGVTTKYWPGDKEGALFQAAWFGSTSGNRTHAVGELKANSFGLFDIHGNVWEWVHDGWEPAYYERFQERPALNPNGVSPLGPARLVRGGNWNAAAFCRASCRNAIDPTHLSYNVGFRVALTLDAVRQALKVTGSAMSQPVATNLDRALAEWVISQGGSVQLDGQTGTIDNVEKLPSTPIQVQEIKLEAQDSLTDDDFERLRGLQKLTTIYVIGSQSGVTDRGFERLADAIPSSLTTLIFYGNLPNVTDAAVTDLNRLANLKILGLHASQLTNDGMAAMSLPLLADLGIMNGKATLLGLKDAKTRLPSLFVMQVEGVQIPAEEYPILSQWSLGIINLVNVGIRDQDLPSLHSHLELTTLSLRGNPAITDAGVPHLLAFGKLNYLVMDYTEVSNEGFAQLQKLPELNLLYANHLKLTDAGFATISQFAKLQVLRINETEGITDATLEQLAKCATLQSLSIQGCPQLTEAGVRKLQAALPKCKITSDFPESPVAAHPPLPEFFATATWSAPVNLGSTINTPAREATPSLTSDELLLVFTRGEELFEARRASRDEPFAPATKLAGPLPSAKFLTSCLSGDGLQLVLSAIPPGGNAQDVMIATRTSRDEPFGQPVALPQSINAPGEDRHPVLSPDGLILALTSVRGGQQTGGLLIFTRPNPTAEFNPTPTVDARLQGDWSVITSFSSDGRGLLKAKMADDVETITWHTRTADSPGWSEGQPLPAPFDAIQFGAPFLSADGNTIYFHSRYVPDGQGDLDLWVSRRTMKTP